MDTNNKENNSVNFDNNCNSDNKENKNDNIDNNQVVSLAKAVMVDNGKTATESTKKKKKKKKIYVSNTKKPFFFYLNLAKSHINQYNHVELSALGTAIPTVVKIAEVLKRDGLAVEKKIMISTFNDSKEDEKGYLIEKAKIEIVLGKAEKLDMTTVADKLDMTTVAIALKEVVDEKA